MRSSWRRNSLGALTISPRNWSVQRMLRGVSAARGLAGGGLPLVILAGGGEQLPPVDPVPHTLHSPQLVCPSRSDRCRTNVAHDPYGSGPPLLGLASKHGPS
jgi:hypothetical protein